MSTLERIAQPPIAGERLSRDEFFERWERLPDLKRAELIGGIVYMPSPLSKRHSSGECLCIYCVRHYSAHTVGCESGCHASWFMLEDMPQPDAFLCISPKHGGQSGMDRNNRDYPEGAPELIIEVCVSSAAYDLGPKLKLYERAGVKEYIAVLMKSPEIVWHRLEEGKFRVVQPDHDEIFRSAVFPGLWLDTDALLREDDLRVLETLNQGLQTPEHADFVRALAARRR